MKDAFTLVLQAKAETKHSAFLTPWGIRECKAMGIESIAATFGEVAAEFWEAVRSGRIVGVHRSP